MVSVKSLIALFNEGRVGGARADVEVSDAAQAEAELRTAASEQAEALLDPPEGNTIVSGSDDNTVRIWNATSGEEQHVLKGHSLWVNSVAIQGDTIVSGSDDNTVRIWNATSGEEQHVLKWHFDAVTSVAIQGDTVVSQSRNKTLYWNARTDEAFDADEAKASTTLGTNTLVNVENGTHVKFSEGIGFTTDYHITRSARQGSVYVIGDDSGMVHVLHVQEIEPGT
ncbi:WD repeat-containing protein 5 [Hondaea fermentalgiana]|uniref:WD repeat-containing protein 5 n=1 Tax=Hondaea fermentalgiana TaxID=2315210 RepID=A0A2R5GMQ2_9STRA|nr:WD repeat-containing protein 5 [Hondaea fermentalgiana]|eukprot:GBG31905.1 WD repeat-containing protein 5 [Hondaea fermentalgiana]